MHLRYAPSLSPCRPSMHLTGLVMAAAQHRSNDLLRAARLRRGLSRSELADAANRHPAMASSKAGPMTENFVGKLEQGRVAFPRAERRAALRAILGVATDADIGLVRTRDQPAGPPSFAADAFIIDLGTMVDSSNGQGDAVFNVSSAI